MILVMQAQSGHEDFRLVLKKPPLCLSYFLCSRVSSLGSVDTCCSPSPSPHNPRIQHTTQHLAGMWLFGELDQTECPYLFCYLWVLLKSSYKLCDLNCVSFSSKGTLLRCGERNKSREEPQSSLHPSTVQGIYHYMWCSQLGVSIWFSLWF